MKQWDIWRVDQQSSRDKSDPKQPGDPSKPYRYYVVISNDDHLKKHGHPTIIEIQSKQINKIMFVPIVADKETGLHHNSFVCCNQIFTVEREFLTQKIGSVPEQTSYKIRMALAVYLELLE